MDRLSKTTIPIRIDGMWFMIPPYPGDLGFIHECLLERTYERHRRFVPLPGWICLDIGANIGACTARWRKNDPDGCIICVEPHPLSFERLRANVEKNGWPNTRCINAAVGSANGTLRLMLQRTQARVEADEFTSDTAITVECITIAELFKREKLDHIDLCKIDVEGHEAEVLKGGANCLSRVSRIVVEYHSPELRSKVKEILARDFVVVHEESTQEGTIFFINRKAEAYPPSG